MEAERSRSVRNRVLLRAFLVFVTTYVVLMGVVLFLVGTTITPYLNTWTARLTAWTLRLLGANGQSSGPLVTSSVYSAEIITECTAVYIMILFLSAVSAYPTSWKAKLSGVLLGAPALVIVNQIRLVSMFYIGHLFPSAAETIHLLVWQSLMVFFTVFIWLFWAVKSGLRSGYQRT